MLLCFTNAKVAGGLQHMSQMMFVGLCLFVVAGCALPSRSTATPTLQVDRGSPKAQPALTSVSQFWTNNDFDCWTASAEVPVESKASDPGHLLVATGNRGDNLTVYRFDFATNQYEHLFGGALAPGRFKPLPISPDGQYLWYAVRERSPIAAHYPYTDTVHIYSMLDGSTRRVPFPVNDKRRLEALDSAIGWSPDSKCLIWWVMDTATAYRLSDGAMQSKIFPNTYFGVEVSPAPTGRIWIWNAGSDIGLMQLKPEASNGIELGKFSTDTTAYYFSKVFRWSRDGSSLTIVYSTKDVLYGSTARIRLVNFANDAINNYEDIQASVTNLQWSPNGRHLLIFLGQASYQIYDQTAGVFTEISSQHGHSFESMPTWSPTSDQIAFVAGDEHSLYIVNADGTGEKPLPAPPSGNSTFFIIWTP